MSLVRRAIETRAVTLSEALRREDSRRGRATHAGPVVTSDKAQMHSAVWAATGLIADTIATLPVAEMRKGPNGLDVPTGEQPDVIFNPTPDIESLDWRRQMMISLLLRGNGIGLITERDRNGNPSQIETVHPDNVTVFRRRRLEPLTWKIYGTETPRDQIFHIPAYTQPGSPIGLSPIEYARQAIGLGLAVEEFGARWFGDGAHPTGVLTGQGRFKDQETPDRLKDRFMAAIRGREVAVLSQGLNFEPIQIAPEESQFLETIGANVRTIARFYNVPPEVIGGDSGGGSVLYANVEQRALLLTTFTLRQWVRRLETYLSTLRPAGRFIRFDVDDLHVADILARARVADLRVRGGMWNVDEARAVENRAPLPNGDGQRYLWPPQRGFKLEADEEQGA